MKPIITRVLCLTIAVMMLLTLSGCFSNYGGVDDVWVETRPGGGTSSSVDNPTETSTRTVDPPQSTASEIGYTIDAAGFYVINRFTYAVSSEYDPVTPTYSYDSLQNEDQRTVYRAIYENFYSVSDRINNTDVDGLYPIKTVELTGKRYKSTDMYAAFDAAVEDHPEIFWVSGYISYVWDGDKTEINTFSSYSPDAIISKMKSIESKIESFLSSLSTGMSPFEREIYIHDYISGICTYDDSYYTIPNYTDDHPEIANIDGVLLEGRAVCEGYSRAASMLMRKVGIECVNVSGTGDNGSGNSELHMWNCVKLDGEWYGLDVTWDDTDDDYISYDYCNIPDSEMKKDHVTDKMYSESSESEITGSNPLNTYVPRCNATTYTYYLREYAHLTDVNSDELKNALYEAASAGENTCSIYVDPNRYTVEQVISLLFESSPQIYYQDVEEVNAMLTDRSIDSGSTSYLTNEKRNVISFILKYV